LKEVETPRRPTSSRPPTRSARRAINHARTGLTGRQAVAEQAVDQQFARWVMPHAQSNPLPVWIR
jgi:hypothetical protein